MKACRLDDRDRVANVCRREPGEIVRVGIDGVEELQQRCGAFSLAGPDHHLAVGLLGRGGRARGWSRRRC